MGFLKSKKAWATIIGIVTVIMGQFMPDWQPAVEKILYAIMAYVIGQGVADLGKGAAEVNAAKDA